MNNEIRTLSPQPQATEAQRGVAFTCFTQGFPAPHTSRGWLTTPPRDASPPKTSKGVTTMPYAQLTVKQDSLKLIQQLAAQYGTPTHAVVSSLLALLNKKNNKKLLMRLLQLEKTSLDYDHAKLQELSSTLHKLATQTLTHNTAYRTQQIQHYTKTQKPEKIEQTFTPAPYDTQTNTKIQG